MKEVILGGRSVEFSQDVLKRSPELCAAVGAAPPVISETRAEVKQSTEETPGIKAFTVMGDPVPKPRMTRRDKWLKPRRACVQRYYDYKDKLRKEIKDMPTPPDELHCAFYIAVPDSWPKSKRLAMDGKPHRSKPDRDNLEKAVMDALFSQDCSIWKGQQEKFWTWSKARTEIKMIWH